MVMDSFSYMGGYNMNAYNNMNNDFMYAQLANQGVTNTPANQYGSGVSFGNRPQIDTFEHSSGNNNGLWLTAAGTAGAGWYGYAKANPILENGKFHEDFIKTANNISHDAQRLKIAENLLSTEKATILGPEGITDGQHYSAIEKLAKGETLTPSERTLVGTMTEAEAQAKVANVKPKLDAIKLDDIAKKATEQAQEYSLTHVRETIANNNSAKSLLESLSDTATQSDIEKLIKDNPKAFGITATEESAIATEAQALATKGKTQLINDFGDAVTKLKTKETTLLGEAETLLKNYWDDTAKAFKNDAPEAITKGFKNFKWKQAGKYGIIATGVGLLLNWAFGGKK